jgi:peptidoglycan/xylan/chitin deacetylase (PgdA/CDA1 family)
MRLVPVAVLVMAVAAGPAIAVGPATVGRSDRSLWPERLDTPSAFDAASRAEILSFVAALGETRDLDAGGLAAALGVKSANFESAQTWRRLTVERLAENFRRASATCTARDWLCDPKMTAERLEDAAARLDASVPERLRAWRENARAFHRAYAKEQLRLAALFPHPTSEVLTVAEGERSGFELPDRRFLLTFDDGPSARNGSTDDLRVLLRQAGRNGVFYVLGDRLEARQEQETDAALREGYAGMCVGSHGARHVSHQGLSAWQASVTDMDVRLRRAFGGLYRPLFRPPYGQRKVDSAAFFAEHGLAVALWNIDSQDWSAAVDAADVESRVLSLMLLWRRGVILFHDVHRKAERALPGLWRTTEGSGVAWMDCAQY